MAKKGLGENIREIILETIKGQLITRLKEQFDDLVDKAQDAIVVTQQKLIRSATSVALFILGITIVIFGALFLLIDVYNYSRSTVFLVAGFIIVLISVVLAQSAKLLKYHLKG